MGCFVLSVYFGHDASLALVGDGKIAHVEFERLTRRRHQTMVPRERVLVEALPGALRLVGARMTDVVAVVEVGCGDSLAGGRNDGARDRGWSRDLAVWDAGAGSRYFGPLLPAYYVPHHLAHAAYSFYTSPYEAARVVAIDGGGDALADGSAAPPYIDGAAGGARHAFGDSGASWRLRALDRVGVGARWSQLARAYCGDEHAAGTIMAMGGVPEGDFERLCALPLGVREEIARLQDDTTAALEIRAAGTQGAVCLSGGVALNGIAARRVLARGDVASVHVPPAVNDGGLSVGAALFCLHAILGEPRARYATETVAFAGYTDDEIAGEPDAGEVGALLAHGHIVAACHGRAESGPRALGHRSLLACGKHAGTKELLNALKGRQPFRPVAPVVLRGDAERYFDLKDPDAYSFMTLIAPARELMVADVPAGVHLDGTARVQVVDEASWLGRVVAAYRDLTGVPVILNTSFNLRGEAMVNDAAQARDTFVRSRAGALVVGSQIVEVRP